MGKIYVQDMELVWGTSTCIAGSTTSGSFPTRGHARLVGGLITCTSAVAASGLRIKQSLDGGTNWDFISDFVPTACSGSAYSIEIVGNWGRIDFIPETSASIFRTGWWLRPI